MGVELLYGVSMRVASKMIWYFQYDISNFCAIAANVFNIVYKRNTDVKGLGHLNSKDSD